MGEKAWLKNSRLWRILHKPLLGTRVLPHDARADCAKLSEEEFPVICPKCDYQLRGLPDGKCPECGKPFERARLLVEQYIRPWVGSSWRSTFRRRTMSGRIAYWSFVVLVVCDALMFVGFAFICIWALLPPRQATPPPSGLISNIQWEPPLILALLIAMTGSLAVFVLIVFGQRWRLRHKRRRVLDTLPVDPAQED